MIYCSSPCTNSSNACAFSLVSTFIVHCQLFVGKIPRKYRNQSIIDCESKYRRAVWQTTGSCFITFGSTPVVYCGFMTERTTWYQRRHATTQSKLKWWNNNQEQCKHLWWMIQHNSVTLFVEIDDKRGWDQFLCHASGYEVDAFVRLKTVWATFKCFQSHTQKDFINRIVDAHQISQPSNGMNDLDLIEIITLRLYWQQDQGNWLVPSTLLTLDSY